MQSFKEVLTQQLNACKANNFTDNYDARRFGKKQSSVKDKIKEQVIRLLFTLGFYNFAARKRIWNNIDNLAWLYERLDDESKTVLVQIISYRVMGEKYVKLPLNTPAFWKKLDELDGLAQAGEKLELGYQGRYLNKMNLQAEGYPIEIFARPSGINTQMLLQQYRCQAKDTVIDIEPGDVVIDAGGCYGDTAIEFAYKTGSTGKVYSWEFMPDNLAVFDRNLQLNPEFAKQIEQVKNPLWSTSGQKLYVSGIGPGARVSPTPPENLDEAVVVETYTIDALCKDKNLSKIDFIKMDIESAELQALKGAENTIRQFKPKLAISVYHGLEDFWEIPQWIDALGLGYQFHLRHFTIHTEETVLFAIAE